ncbi:MAG: hypothetical protein ABSD90_07450 [Methylocystis sp.]|jgi:hypothetical protein
MMTAKSALKHVAGVLMFAAIFLLTRYYVTGELLEFNKEPFSVTMEHDAARLNATLPEMVSEGVRLDKAAAGPGNLFNYIYTVVDDDAASKIVADPKELDKLRSQLRERVCTVMPAYRNNNTIVRYSLRNNSGDIIADISINPKDC